MTGTTEQNKAVVLEYLTEYWGKGNASVVDKLCTESFEMNYPLVPGVKGREAAKKAIEGLNGLFSDFEFHPVGPLIAENLPEGEFVCCRIEGGGKHTGGAVPNFFVGDLPAASEKSIHITGQVIFKLENGKIQEEIGEEGALTALQQLGLVDKV